MKNSKILIKFILSTVFILALFAIFTIFAGAEGQIEGERDNEYDWEYISIFSEGLLDEYDYTSKAIKPSFKLYYLDENQNKVYFKKNVDYTVEYNNFTLPGTAYVSVNSTSSCDIYFSDYIDYKITLDESKLSISNIGSYEYAAKYIEPKVNVYYKNSIKISSADYYGPYYYNNYNPGKATVEVNVCFGNVDVNVSKNFTIKKAPASKVKISSVPAQEYNGSKITPYFDVTFNGEYVYEDSYTVSFKNNKYPGTATATLKFKGNFTGTKAVTFKIKLEPIYSIYTNSYGNEIYLSYYSSYASGYQIYRYDTKTKEYKKIKTTKNDWYTDTKLSQFTTYKYKIRPYLKANGTTYYGSFASTSAKTLLSSPKVALSVKKGIKNVSWGTNSKATSYILYRRDLESWTTKKLGTFNSKTTKYTDKSSKDYYSYTYYVIAVKKDGKKTYKSTEEDSKSAYSSDTDVINRGIKLKSKTSYKVYNTQGSKRELYRTVTLSKADINTLKAFAKKHFKKGMTPQQKVAVTLDWINKNNTYANTDATWRKIENKTYVDAIFNYKLGQCAQYNGALAGMMTYLGYNVRLIKGYRQGYSGKIQHFWTECEINGLTYVMETGNYGRNGDWSYFFAPYRYTMGYTLNGKYVSGR